MDANAQHAQQAAAAVEADAFSTPGHSCEQCSFGFKLRLRRSGSRLGVEFVQSVRLAVPCIAFRQCKVASDAVVAFNAVFSHTHSL